MWYEIVEIVEQQPEGIGVVVNHENRRIPATIIGSNLDGLLIGQSFPAEIGYDKILAWKVIDDLDDARSGVWQEPDGIHLLGRVHNILDYGDGKTIVDVYIQNGSEFFTVDAEGLDAAALEGNDGLEITVGKLHVYPIE